MPELPEAETIARGLSRVLPGKRVSSVQVRRTDVVEGDPQRFRALVKGAHLEAVGRRGKNVVLLFRGGNRIVVNLGMTGRLLPATTSSSPPESRHPAVVFGFDDGTSLTYDDVRRFGRVTLFTQAGWSQWSRRLGPEPLSPSFSRTRLGSILAKSKSPVRSLLLDQRKIAGVGNIYAVEALWKAKVHPARRSTTLDLDETRALHRALRQVLRKAIEARGTTLRDYRTAEGEPGGFGPELLAYGREGQGCRRCRTPLERMRLSGRSAFFCPACQVEPGEAVA